MKTLIRYAITKIDDHGMRTLATANQGRFFSNNELDARVHLGEILQNTHPDTLQSVYGDVSKMEVRPVECYENGDAKGIYFAA